MAPTANAKKRARPWHMDGVPGPFSDHVYKRAHGVDVPLRVWPATAGSGPRPFLVWYHGGGFTCVPSRVQR